jgi:glycosyltransferase involved in cell wall biosynthesis
MPTLAEAHGRRLRLLALVHHPLAAETGLPPARAAALRESEARALAQARGVLVTSAATARLLADYGVPAERVRVVEPGTDPAPAAGGSRGDCGGDSGGGSGGGATRLLCVATLVPRKGHDALLGALAGLADVPWRLDCVGCPDRDPAWAGRLLELTDALGLSERVAFRGVLPDPALEQCYARADVFVLASRFEGYGMAVAEALAHGLPVLATRAGAADLTVPAGAGILVEPDDPVALRQALRDLLAEPALRRRLAAGARAAARRLPTWGQAAEAFAAACAELVDG